MKQYRINCIDVKEDFIEITPTFVNEDKWVTITIMNIDSSESEVLFPPNKIKELIKELNKYLEE